MATGEPSAWDAFCTSQLNVVLLGGRNSGKSSVGNLLLGKEEFVAKERTACSRRLAVAWGRRLMVVDTPGWWCDFSAQDTCELVKREIRSSVSLCPPGPHVFLIAVKLSSAFSERRGRAVEEHVALLGERAWGHCVLVLTGVGADAPQEHVRRLGERCGGRSQAVDPSDGSGVAELLGKIEELVRENGNRAFELEEDILQAVAEERRSVEERAHGRLMRGRQRRTLTQERLRPVTDIRMVLLGAKGSGKSSVLNTILGRDREARPLGRTARSTAETGVVFGRRVTVVDTPGWWMNYFSDESTALDLRELVRSLSLCPPGPHVFLLVVRSDRAFTETYRRAVQEHLGLIGERIWDRTLLLLTCGDWLGGTGAELYVEGEGQPLRWLVDRCGDRFHVLDNTIGGDGFQVRELIGKIESMLAGGDGERFYEIERGALEQMEERGRRENERAKERRMKKESRRQMARIQLEKLDPLPEIRLVLVGGRKCGKSSCGNTILSRECFDVDAHKTSCAENQGRIGGRTVTVLDTPEGFSVTPDLLGPPPACAVLLVVNVSSSFKDKHREDLEKQLEGGGGGGGGEMWSRSMVVFSHGDWLGGTSVEQRIESEGEALRVLVEKCGNRYHVLDNSKRGGGAQVDELMELVEEMLAGGKAERGADHMRGSAREESAPEPDAATLCPKDFKVSCDSTESATPAIQPAGGSTEGTDASGQIVAVAAAATAGRRSRPRDRDRFMSILSSGLCSKKALRWTAAAAGIHRLSVDPPLYFPAAGAHHRPRLNGERQVSIHPTLLVLLPEAESRMFTEESDSQCHPALRGRTLGATTEAGGLQRLIDQWERSSLEELEAFIDAYFEMVWEESMESLQPTEPAPQKAEVAAAEDVLASIDRKLSKLQLVEEIKSDLMQLRESLENCWRVIQELRDKSPPDPIHVNTEEKNHLESKQF